ncbi:glycosyltransferase family 4 protein [Aestuariibaculum sp. YM273]|uniref:glycosyltransferase family 4 protein n=1 Tax=Aestuariibaculum sp. YM273 TaxID=3070659 RepID=UPI0027DB7EB5|nr:glycosyltransferase family 4 protein [Aestuariibaculum sp. YM273]WMI65807.1 glycosyltransferase family 4 protein [Aestuariibaculum sp. YM273]
MHKKSQNQYFGYAPYVREMNLWFKHVDQVEVLGPLEDGIPTDIDLPYVHRDIQFTTISEISLISFIQIIKTLWFLPIILLRLFQACRRADHIHLRCPGNIGLLGCLVQILFPNKIKTAKYAGNWDPKAKQPLSYRLQKWVLSNTFLTRNMQVLVYGHWPKQTKNILPFFTASYTEGEREILKERKYDGQLHFVFVGSLVSGKRPLLAIQIVETLLKQGRKVQLDLYGDGVLKSLLEDYVQENGLERVVRFHGNQSKEQLKAAYRAPHFLILASKSEGWPKAVAEGMFFGVIPIATDISCVSDMLGRGERGILIQPELELALQSVNNALRNEETLQNMSALAMKWSQKFTLDRFEKDIKALIQSTQK